MALFDTFRQLATNQGLFGYDQVAKPAVFNASAGQDLLGYDSNMQPVFGVLPTGFDAAGEFIPVMNREATTPFNQRFADTAKYYDSNQTAAMPAYYAADDLRRNLGISEADWDAAIAQAASPLMQHGDWAQHKISPLTTTIGALNVLNAQNNPTYDAAIEQYLTSPEYADAVKYGNVIGVNMTNASDAANAEMLAAQNTGLGMLGALAGGAMLGVGGLGTSAADMAGITELPGLTEAVGGIAEPFTNYGTLADFGGAYDPTAVFSNYTNPSMLGSSYEIPGITDNLGLTTATPSPGVSSLYEAATGSSYPSSLASNTGGALYNAATGGTNMDWIDRALNWAGSNPDKLLSGALQLGGSYLSGNAAQEAAQTTADAQIQAAKIAADAAKFRPVGVTTRFGNSNFVYDSNGNLVAAGYGMSPDVQAQQNTLMGMTPGLLAQYQGAQAATAPMGQAAGTMMGLGNQYLSTDPLAQAQKYYNDQQAIMAAQRERDLAKTLTGEFNRGTYGLATGGTSTGMMAANPRLEAMYNAQRQQDLQAAAQATQGGMDYSKFGAGMVGSGGEMLKGMYGTQSAARGPWDTAMGGATYLEGLAQQPMDMGINIGAKGTAANAQSGMLMAQGMTNAAQTMQPTNAYSPWGSMLQGAGNMVSQYANPQQQYKFDPYTGQQIKWGA